MASCQQQKPPPQPQFHHVCVTCKAYPGKTLGIKHDGSVDLVDKVEQWERVPLKVNQVKGELKAFLLVKNGQALAHGKAGEKVYMVPYIEGAFHASNMSWGEFESNEPHHISAGRDNNDAITHVYCDLDVNKIGDRTEVVVNAPSSIKESQLWNISPLVT